MAHAHHDHDDHAHDHAATTMAAMTTAMRTAMAITTIMRPADMGRAFAIGVGAEHRLRRGRGRGRASGRARWRCWPTPATTSPTCWRCCWPGARWSWPGARRPSGGPMACARPPSWPRWPTPSCCCWRWAPSSRKRSAGSPSPRRSPPTSSCSSPASACVINTATALMFMRGSQADLNVRGAFLHMASDAAVSLAVVIGAGLIALTGLQWIDPALSLVHRRGDRAGHLGPAARLRGPGAGRRAHGRRRGRGARLALPACRASRRSTTCTSGP